ncbi:hypothetical protein CVT25_003938 [Psilocybe cyanescens]|uniref:Uncharacterized protein n=1 Tax=Psilocybe cyanescens TaxID=93625 RepID=A0A409WXW1_PSICY|nr:hypothetical protein CVT25_003938 [Psilocybe cyanescens]
MNKHRIGATYVTTMVFWITVRRGLDQVPLGFCIAFPCILSNRLVLNIRSASLHNHSKGAHVSYRSREIQGMQGRAKLGCVRGV